MARKRKKSWYGVRTLVRVIAAGEPKVRDRHFDPQSTLVEERVVLFLAASGDDALRQGEAEAREYCRTIRFVNAYGQRVRLKYLRVADAFCMLDHEPRSGCEVFSSTAFVPISVSDAAVVKQRIGKQTRPSARSRLKFVDARIIDDWLNHKPVPNGRG